jgi:formylglycine-generating enzyme
MIRNRFIISSLACICVFGFSAEEIKPYEQLIPNSNEKIALVPIPGGTFLMGSPETEANRRPDEGPQKIVKINPFWMATTETTWDTYLIFQNKELEKETSQKVDAIARPTKPYVEMSFGQGKNGGFPACNITQFAARSYCKWLYQTTGIFYRLPTEAEWEYAARAGSTSPFYFGDKASSLGEYGWYFENSGGAYKKVGLKKPNAWGLYDMHGNVAEWTSDEYSETGYRSLKDGETDAPHPPSTLYPHSIRGGHWDDDPEMLRSAARRPSTPRLKQRDPQIPRSKWWLTDAPFLGFRIVRPVVVPSKAEIEAYYALPPSDI